jgi:hypothetical protein
MAVSSNDFPVGIENFDKLISRRKIYIDKTSFLESLLTSGDDVALLLRPRRFGKTLSMSMIESFLEINYQKPEDRSRQEKLFKNLAVYKNKELCDEYMGRYPVVSISLKEVEGDNFIDAMMSLLRLLRNLFEKYRFLLDSDKQPDEAKNSLRIKLKTCYNDELNLKDDVKLELAKSIAKDSLKFIGDMLFREYGQRVFFIVDEYDVPLQKATAGSYYDDMLGVVRGMLSSALKTNNSMEKGFVTGCLRISHQSIFTGINHFATFGLTNMQYSTFIGLTKEETEQLLKDCGMENRMDDVRTWYDGYNMAGNDILCPWSVLSFLADALTSGKTPASFKPQIYWINSSGNDIVDQYMRYPTPEDSEKLQKLINGESVNIELCEFETYPDITDKHDFDVFATLMLHTGYFTYSKDEVGETYKDSAETQIPIESENEFDSDAESLDSTALIKIPNREVLSCFIRKRNRIFGRKNPEWLEKGCSLRDALFAGEQENVQKIIDSMLMTFISFRDTAYESYYHGFMTGVLSMIATEDIVIKSNQESGNGYFDIILTKKEGKTAVILEFKKSGDDRFITQDRVCDEALDQIESNQYDFHLKQNGCIRILKYGIAFYGKGCTVKMAGSRTAD